MRELFTLKCNRCGSEITILDDSYREMQSGCNNIDIWTDNDKDINILCECGNEIITQGG